MSVDSENSVLNNKYKRKGRLKRVRGITKPIAEKILIFIFGTHLIEVVCNKDNQAFKVFVDSTVSESLTNKVSAYWKGIFEIHKTIKKV